MSCSPPPSCEVPLNFTVPFEADPDVAGIGVIISFLVSAGIALVVAWTAYYAGHINAESLRLLDYQLLLLGHTKAIHSALKIAQYPFILEYCPHHLEARRKKFPFHSRALSTALLVLRDLQLFTGFFMLIVAFARHCSITQYHYQIVTDFAWTAAAVCTGTDFALSQGSLDNPVYKWSRFTLITSLLVALLGGNVVTWKDTYFQSSDDGHYALGLSMQCTWDLSIPVTLDAYCIVNPFFTLWTLGVVFFTYIPSLEDNKFILGIVHIAEICFSAPSRLCSISLAVLQDCFDVLRSPTPSKINTWYERLWISARGIIYSVFIIICLPVMLILFLLTLLALSFWELVRSELFDLLRVLLMLLYATIDIVWLKRLAPTSGMIDSEKEMEWGFGQVMPMLLLVLPLLSLSEVLYDSRDEPRSQKQIGDTWYGSHHVHPTSARSTSLAQSKLKKTSHQDTRDSPKSSALRLPRTNQTGLLLERLWQRASTQDLRAQILGHIAGQLTVLIVIPAAMGVAATYGAVNGYII